MRLAERHNPIVRRVVRRTRPMLEERGLLKRIGVITHPRADDGLPAASFNGEGLVMGYCLHCGLRGGGERSAELYAARCPGAGFLKTILLRRIGSSARAGLRNRAPSSRAHRCIRSFPKRRSATKDCADR